ncbi:hypothetical protein [Kineothrix sp. MB12-C1]|uniref:hypothetical protein n=1 Tax=Kineothrix sp. MB12-C1 TaxID=3070215 RepID=UPI0027D219DD|nr:hypothetical protein [Kineothrix sp. MB12-C1]WMC93200.1 hypothetical protein RBB56_02640 [Kineothrix sp. MB12-C1]
MKKNGYYDIDKLLNDIRSDIEDVLIDEVLDEVKNIELEHIQDDVFRAYSPKIYERREHNGIDDPENIIGEVNNMSLTVDNKTKFNDGYGTYNHGVGLADLINGGDGVNGYYYDYFGEFNLPRPFLDNTKYEIERTNRVDDALVKGMRRRKYNIT